ncbi:lytic transglycosylase domain-containing protein [Thermomonospora umbrina]|uniref:Transglycosylase protein with SLT domain n=1 Tax=Thermomonospora umbrina TaxID=111806 RepID=A0A3D9SHH4_9ACTN|nr:lytic transglycosylase domain-containing protein [Thermomonospora umbrina]REE95342.1 transglycosylase protein with SLT domain [Thermomonospora umbrina]
MAPSSPSRDPGRRGPSTRPEKKARTIRPRPAARVPAAAPSRRLPLLVLAALALVTAVTLTAGVIRAVTHEGTSETAAAPAVPAGEPTGLPGGPADNVVDDAQVAPLRRVVPPDVLVVGTASIDAGAARRISRLKGVRDVAVVDGGAVQLQNRLINTFAVDPSTFRSWTPPGTAKRTELWAALAADRFVVSEKAAGELRLRDGLRYPIVAKTIPNVVLGGSGSLGLPGIDMLVSARTGTRLGLVPDVALLINAPGADPAKLADEVGEVVRGGAKVINLNEERYRPSGQAASYLDLYKRAATSCRGLSWTVLAAIGQVESDHGRNAGRSSAGALGPMQFLPSTWKSFGVDGDGDGKADIMNPYDAIPAAAKYLCAHGGGRGGDSLYQAVYAYNHAHWYVQKVLDLAKAYAARYR